MTHGKHGKMHDVFKPRGRPRTAVEWSVRGALLHWVLDKALRATSRRGSDVWTTGAVTDYLDNVVNELDLVDARPYLRPLRHGGGVTL